MKKRAEEAGATASADVTARKRLLQLPNVGPATAGDLLRLGITRKEELAGRDPDRLYDALCRIDGAPHDVCLRDVFAALVAFANGGPALPWWSFSAERKAREAAASKSAAKTADRRGRAQVRKKR
ncbi:MAG: mitomycin resistance protein [Planctomycetes bacterium]|nr:mitomycin resistance protein [Planctomycetota bacterium]